MTFFSDKILTPRLCLRRIGEDDLPQLLLWNSCQEAWGEYLTPDGSQEQQLREGIALGTFWTEQNRMFLIELKKDAVPIGTIHYWLRVENRQCAAITVRICEPDLRNLGLGTEAQKYLIIHLFDRLHLQEIEMCTDIDNAAQQRCLRKLGFDLVESMVYEDCQVRRLGHLFRISRANYLNTAVYRYHDESPLRSDLR